MARLDDDQLNISEEVARALGYAPRPRRPRQPAAPGPAARRRTGGNVAAAIGWIVTGILGVFGSFLVLTVICFVIVLFTSHKPPTTTAVSARPQFTRAVPATHEVQQHPITSLSAPEPQSAPDADTATQEQAPSVVEPRNLATDSQETMQTQHQAESVPYSVEVPIVSEQSSANQPANRNEEEAVPDDQMAESQPPDSGEESHAALPSFQWVCAGGQVLCGLRDPNGKWVQTFLLANGEITESEIFPETIRPRSWSCQTRGPNIEMYCTIQDPNGQFLQGILYDGTVMKAFANGGRCIQGCSQN